MHSTITVILLLVWVGSAVTLVLTLSAARAFRAAAGQPVPRARAAAAAQASSRVAPGEYAPFASLLKPLSGLEYGLERNLESFFRQDYQRPNPGACAGSGASAGLGAFEILFAARDPDDPALDIVRALMSKHPNVPAKIVDASACNYVNAKVFSLEKMAAEAASDILIISDSDVFVGRDYVREVVAPFADVRVGVSTCMYRGVAGRSFWSRLEALGMSTEFMAGVLLAWKIDGMKFALGPTMTVRRKCLDAIGGFARMADYLADDFVLGQWAHEAGYKVVLSEYVINHQVLNEEFERSFVHRLRWARSSRFSRPAGYVGELFTHPLPLALLLALLNPFSAAFWALFAATVVLRGWAATLVGWGVLRDRQALRRLWLVPLQDLLSFAVWCGGFTGRCVRWRDTVYRVWGDGRLKAID